MQVEATATIEIPDGSKPLHPSYPNIWISPDGSLFRISGRAFRHNIVVKEGPRANVVNAEGVRTLDKPILPLVCHAWHGRAPEGCQAVQRVPGTNLTKGNCRWEPITGLLRDQSSEPGQPEPDGELPPL